MNTLLLFAAATFAGGDYQVTTRNIQSSGQARSFVLATPTSGATGKPLVFALHGDNGTGAGMRASLPLEAAAAGAAVFVYPNAASNNTFEYFSAIGRSREVQFVRDVVNLLQAEINIDRNRVFLSGFSGGGTMANILGCRMGFPEIRGLAVNAGSLYPIDGDFTYTGNGGVSCAMPATMLLWGESDNTPNVSYATGVSIRNNLTATHTCSAATAAFSPTPCVTYNGCQRDVGWCSVPGLGHSIWNQAASASWAFFNRQSGGLAPVNQEIYVDSLTNGWENFSWGVVDFANTSAPHAGNTAIRFSAHSFQGLSFAKPGAAISAAQFPEIRFYIRGSAGGENFNVSLQTGSTLHTNVPLAQFVAGGSVAAGSYREVRIRIAQAPMNYTGSFERINIQDATGASAGAPQVVFVDTVALIAAADLPDALFASGFE